MFKLNLKIQMPKDCPENEKHTSLWDKCHEYMDICEGGHKSSYHMKYIQAIYNKLKQKPNLSSKQKLLLEVLEEFLLKYDIDRVSLDSVSMFRSKDDEPEKGDD